MYPKPTAWFKAHLVVLGHWGNRYAERPKEWFACQLELNSLAGHLL